MVTVAMLYYTMLQEGMRGYSRLDCRLCLQFATYNADIAAKQPRFKPSTQHSAQYDAIGYHFERTCHLYYYPGFT